ncbi:hypothetical protein BGZ65_011542, partial [Modicella reniformis]
MADLEYPRDVKVTMTSDEAAVPLLASKEKSEATLPRGPCPFQGFRRGPCTSEQRAQVKARVKKFFLRLFAALLIVWAYFALFGTQDNNDDDDDGWSLLDLSEETTIRGAPSSWSRLSSLDQAAQVFNHVQDMMACKCFGDMVPWDGPSTLETSHSNIRVNFGEGFILSNVFVRTGDVESPTLFIHANVTRTRQDDDDGDDGGDDDDDDGDDDGDDGGDDDGEVFRMGDDKGLHLDVKETEDAIDVTFWADNFVPGGDGDGDEDPTPTN